MTAVKMLWGPAAVGTVGVTSAALGSTNLSDADNSVGWTFSVPTDGSIASAGFYISSLTGTPPAYNVGVVTVGTDGSPTTTAYGGSAIKSYTPTGTGWTWVALDTPATANAGDFAAVRIWPGGTSPDGSNYIAVTSAGVAEGGVGWNYTTAWSSVGFGALMAVKYATSNAVYGFALNSNTTFADIRSNTTPDEVGCKFQVPAAMTCSGAKVVLYGAGFGSAATLDIVLYSAADAVLASATIGDKDYVDPANYATVSWDAVNLSAGTDYRLVVKPTTGTNGNVVVPKFSFESAGAMLMMPCGDSWQWTQRTDAGAWTDTNTAIAPMGLWVSGITFGGGATAYEYGYIG
jgi:hypothetical protein